MQSAFQLILKAPSVVEVRTLRRSFDSSAPTLKNYVLCLRAQCQCQAGTGLSLLVPVKVNSNFTVYKDVQYAFNTVATN